MRSRINSTGRTKIPRHLATFVVNADDGEEPQFTARIRLDNLDLPPDGEVVVEAYRQSLNERFDFGTVAAIGARSSTVLRELEPDSLSFRIKVVEPGTGRLLARGDKFQPKGTDDGARHELLKVIRRNLGAEPWKTEIHDTGLPVLVLNEHIPNVLNRIRTDRTLQAFILPAALRQILLMLWVQKADQEDDDDDWITRWLDFAEGITREDRPDWSDDDAVRAWIDGVCRAFSKRHDFIKEFEE